MALSANQPRDYQVGINEAYPLAAGAEIFEGSAVGENGAGYARPLQAGDKFLGFAIFPVNNTGGGAGAERVELKTSGRVRLNVLTSSISSNARPAVYAIDDEVFTLVQGSNSVIGYVSRWVSGTECIVEFDARGV